MILPSVHIATLNCLFSIIPPALRASGLGNLFDHNIRPSSLGGMVYHPPPFRWALFSGVAGRYGPFFGPKCVPKPPCYFLLSYDAAYDAFRRTSGPKLNDFESVPAIKNKLFNRDVIVFIVFTVFRSNGLWDLSPGQLG